MQTTTKRGYDIQALPDRDPPRPNGWLTFGKKEIKMWVFDVTAGFAMSGTTAQSSHTRTFFPRNFVQPAFTISVQCPTQRHAGDLAEFIRDTQRSLRSSTRLEIVAGWPKGNHGKKLKGPHSNIAAEGYIKSVQRESMAFNYSPEVSFDFVIERMIAPGAWADSPVTIRRLKSWHDIVEGILKNDTNAGFQTDPDQVQRPANLPGTTGLAPGPDGDLRPG